MQVKFIDLYNDSIVSQEWYDIDEGATITRNLNETLNSASIRISHISEDLQLQPLDDVTIRGSFGTMDFCIESYNQYQISLDPVIYTYEISLCSLTKKLEGIILPNLSNTPRKVGDKVSIRSFASGILAQYSPRNNNGAQKFQLSLTVEEPQWDDECPELQWNTPNLREILNDLLMLKDCVANVIRVENIYYVGRLNLYETGEEINDSNFFTEPQFNYIKKAQSIDDYASELKMTLVNSVQNDVDDNKHQGANKIEIDNTVTTYEHLHFTTSDFVITDANFYLKTKFPILRIKHLWMHWYSTEQYVDPQVDTLHFTYLKADLCNIKFPQDNKKYSLVKEKSEYDLLNVEGTIAGSFPTNKVESWASSKNSCVYYTRGSNIIDGFRTINKITTVIGTTLTLKLLAQAVEIDCNTRGISNTMSSHKFIGYGTTDPNVGSKAVNLYMTPTFEIEYETSAGCVFSASKNDVPRNQRTIMDNQTNSWVDVHTQGKLEYQKVNRIGNQVLEFNGRVLDYDNAIQLRQTYGDVIIYRTEYQFYEEFVNVTAYGTKNYVLRNYFTGVNSKIRTWVNAKEEAFVRNELKKYYIEFSKTDKASQVSNDFAIQSSVYFASPFFNSNVAEPVKYAMIMTQFNSTLYPDKNLIGKGSSQTNEWYFVTELSTRLVGNSIVFTTGFDDNYIGSKTFRFGSHTSPNTNLKEDGILSQVDVSNNYFTDTFSDGFYDSVPPRISGDSIGFFTDLLFGQQRGGLPITSVKYTNDDGNTTALTVILRDRYPKMSLTEDTEYGGSTFYNFLQRQYQAENEYLLEVHRNVFKDKYNIRKDNKEILQLSIQFEFCSDTRDIEFTDEFVKRQKAIRTSEPTNFGSLKVYGFNGGARDYLGDGTIISYTTSTNGNTKLNITPSSQNDYEWYIITDNDGVEIMRTKVKEFYLSIRRSRNEKEYNI